MPDAAASLLENVVGLYEQGVNQFVIGYATGVDWPADRMQVYGAQFAQVYQWYQAHKARGDLRISEMDKIEENSPGYFGCQAGRISVTVTVGGEVSPCAKILALDNRKLLAKLGDVTYGLTHLANRSELVTARQVRTACQAAWHRRRLRGRLLRPESRGQRIDLHSEHHRAPAQRAPARSLRRVRQLGPLTAPAGGGR